MEDTNSKSTMEDIGPRRSLRFSHMAVQLDHYILVLGGTWVDDIDEEEEKALPLHEIWVHNLYSEQWRKHVMPDQKTAPPGTVDATATVIGSDTYMFGGWMIRDDDHERQGTTDFSNALWKLSKTSNGGFAWQQIKSMCKEKSPSPRYDHSAWEFENNLWIIGGRLPLSVNQSDYLNDHGDCEEDNNQLLCFDLSSGEWTNPRCFGDTPEPCAGHGMSIIRARAWFFGGFPGDADNFPLRGH